MKNITYTPFFLLFVFTCGYIYSSNPEIDFMSGYWSCHFTFSPAPYDLPLLKKQAAEDPKFAKQIKLRKIDFSKPSKRWPFYFQLYHSREQFFLDFPEPPEQWVSPGFDDSLWPRHILPQLTGRSFWRAQVTGLACFRARFTVNDPDAVRSLRITARFRGGALVYVNGKEVGRAYLPAGKIDSSTPSEPYPETAYVLPRIRIGNYDSKGERAVTELIGKFPGPNHYIKYKKSTSKLFGKEPIDNLAGMGNKGREIITREEWEKVQGIRDRELTAKMPSSCLRKGINTLCVEIHRSNIRPGVPVKWLHTYFIGCTAEYSPAGSVLPEKRPQTIQVWTDDIHRRYFEKDYGPSRERTVPLRIAGARNGSFSGQFIIGTHNDITSPKVSVGNLVSSTGNRISPAAITVRYCKPHSMAEVGVKKLSANAQGGRGMESLSTRLAKVRYAPDVKPPKGLRSHAYRKWKEKMLSRIIFFDHLSPDPPASISADTCLPVWITVKIPPAAKPGLYAGTITVAVSGNRTDVPVRLQVMDWTLPDPEQFSTVLGMEPSPYGVSNHYKVAPWSDKHFRLMKNTFRLMALLGNDLVIVPVLLNSEFGNKNDSIIRWKRVSGGYECDCSLLKRFLGIAAKYSKPSCICFVISHSSRPYSAVKKGNHVLLQNGPEKDTILEVPKAGTQEAAAFWKPFIRDVRKCMKEQGMEKSLHWGHLGDNLKGETGKTIKMFKELSPEIGWARSSHGWGGPKTGFSFSTTVRHASSPFNRNKSRIMSCKGWKREWNRLVFTRVENHVSVVYGFSSPYRYRIAPERAVVCGCNGIGRWGLDYWAGTYPTWGNITPTVLSFLWPGPEGAETSARFECFREGLQETEARVFLEKKMEEKEFAESGTEKKIQKILDQRITDQFIQVLQSADNCPQPKIEEYYSGWQQSSWDLYSAAAEASGGTVPDADAKKRFFQ